MPSTFYLEPRREFSHKVSCREQKGLSRKSFAQFHSARVTSLRLSGVTGSLWTRGLAIRRQPSQGGLGGSGGRCEGCPACRPLTLHRVLDGGRRCSLVCASSAPLPSLRHRLLATVAVSGAGPGSGVGIQRQGWKSMTSALDPSPPRGLRYPVGEGLLHPGSSFAPEQGTLGPLPTQ